MNSDEATSEQSVAFQIPAQFGRFGQVLDDPSICSVRVLDEEEALDGQENDRQDNTLDLIDDQDFELFRGPFFC
jgi:hypothetical protein